MQATELPSFTSHQSYPFRNLSSNSSTGSQGILSRDHSNIKALTLTTQTRNGLPWFSSVLFFAVMDGKALACQHPIAQKLAEELSDYEVIEAEDRFLYDLAIEARGHNRHQVLFVSNDSGQTANSARMLTSEHIPIVDVQTYLNEYC
jgi:hypothetical protein